MTVTARLTGAAVLAVTAAVVFAAAGAAADGVRFPNDRANHGVGAIALGAAGAASMPNDRARHGVGGVVELAPAVAGSPRRPDDLGAARGPGAIGGETTPIRPDDRGVRPTAGASTPAAAVVSSSPGFDWGDAGIGAFGGAGLVLLLVGATALLLARRDHTRVALR